MPVRVGQVIAGKYRVERVIGEGGMGVVVAARHLALGELVAVKVIRNEHAQKTDVVTRFHREARAVAKLRSEHIARVFDVDYLDDGAPYIVMEYLDGMNLDDYLAKHGALEPTLAVSFVMQACEGVAEAHAHGMVHRDLKLKNLHLGRRPDGRRVVKILDFGVVKLAAIDAQRAGEPTITGSSVAVGTVQYMAPEQIQASNLVDARADVWSLGVCMYKLLTGRLPFPGDDWPQVVAAVLGRPPPRVDELRRDVPPALVDVVERALEKSLKRRYRDVAALAKALAPFGNDAGAADRIAALLRGGSSSEDDDARADARAAAAAAAGGDAGHETAPHVRDEELGATIEAPLGAKRVSRVESTIDDAAATLSHAPTKSPSSGAPAKLAGVALFLAAALTTIVVVRLIDAPAAPRPTSTQAASATATEPPPAPTATSPVAPAATIAATIATKTTATPASAAPPSPPSPPARVTKTRRSPEPATAPPPTSPTAAPAPTPALTATPAPTPTPTSPYDQF